MEEKVREIFARVCEGVDVNAKNLLDAKLLDSVTMLSLVTEFTVEFGVEIPFSEVVPENFNSIEAITKLVEKYM